MAIDYSKNIDATVGRMEGAPRFYIRGDQVYKQDLLDGDEGFLDPESEEHVDWGETPKGAMKKANKLQKKENQFIINAQKSNLEKRKTKPKK